MKRPRKHGARGGRRTPEEAKPLATIGERIAELRGRSGGTYKAFADRIGAESDTVAAWVNSKARPSADYLIAMAREFGVSADWLLGLRGGANDTEPGEGSIAERTHEQLVRDLLRLSPRFNDRFVRAAIGSPQELWQWLTRVLAARTLAQVTSQRARASLEAIQLLDQARLEAVMALSTEQDCFPKEWLRRSPRSSPASIEETMQHLGAATVTRARRRG